MLTTADFINLPFPADLTQAGIAYACRSLAYTYDRMGGSPSDRLRRIAAGVAVELSFRRHLASQGIPHDTLGMTPFTDPDHYDVAVGGRRCDVKSFLFFEKDKIRRIRRDPAFLLEASALVPSDQLSSDHLGENDLYLFAFATALVTHHDGDVRRALQAGQPAYFIHPLPAAWSRPRRWGPLGELTLKSDLDAALRLELGGQGSGREFQVEQVNLPPGSPVKTRREFYTLSYLHAFELPEGRVGVHSPGLKATQVVYPRAWDNIWVYGMEIILAGYIPRGEFRRQAESLPAGSRTLQYARTRTENMSMPIAGLYPLQDLFNRAKAWYVKRKT